MAFLFLFLGVSFVSAFSVATIYSDGYPLRMHPGDVKETFFLLRNVIEGDSDVAIKSELTKGSEIAKLIDGPKSYDVLFGEEAEVPVRIEIPKDAEIGTNYKVSAVFKPYSKESNLGNIQFVVNIGKSFPVLVVAERETLNQGETDKETYTLTLESEDLVDTFAPFVKGKTAIWIGIIFVLFVGIIIIGLIIIFVLRSRNAALRNLSANQLYANTNI